MTTRRGHAGPVRVAWEGDFEGLHSLALVNRAICRGLGERGHEVRRVQDAMGPTEAGSAASAQVHVRHRWPPNLEPPPRWPLGADAALGVRQPAQGLAADAPAGRRGLGVQPLVRDCYLRAGVPPERVHVIPLGVDPEVFRPGLEPLALPPGPTFRFLFVGGTIFRKGIDVLLEAFARAFRPPTASAW